ncbi:baseplate J protein [Aurantimonas aggregata]|uniref:Baseplate J protein n=1 Tax=Aurantimonas aggregata TaxID=2047720 RepID=A0A6L9MLT4_9HYPH|nr:baseplate J/gp47 family protein [Aurantimonas aggregata]NDV88803.1 baseplate J protein [Aurantimonas aggregata]
MSRFVQADLAALGPMPAVLEVDFEEIRARRGEYLKLALSEFGLDYDVTTIEASPLMVAVARGGGYEEMLFRQLVNEKVRAVSLANAGGGDLDHIAATYYELLSRQSDVDEQGNVIVESDDRFRDRVALASEAFSTAGPLGAYVFQVLELDGVPDIADAWAYSEEDAATYSAGLHADAYSVGARSTPFAGRGNGDPVIAPEVLVVILPAVAYGPCDQSLLDRAYAAASARDVRPIGDNVRIEPAAVVDYAVEMTITYARGADPAPLIAAAEVAVRSYVDKRRRVGVKAEVHGIFGAAYVSGVEAVTGISPTTDVAGGSKQAPNCTGVTIHAVQSEGSWT